MANIIYTILVTLALLKIIVYLICPKSYNFGKILIVTGPKHLILKAHYLLLENPGDKHLLVYINIIIMVHHT